MVNKYAEQLPFLLNTESGNNSLLNLLPLCLNYKKKELLMNLKGRQNSDNINPSARGPFSVLIIITSAIFFGELFLMSVLHTVPEIPPLAAIFLDAVFLVFLTFPVVFLFVYKPLANHIVDLKNGEEERARLANAVEQAAETIVITDKDGTIQYVNPAFEKITGYSTKEAIGQNPCILQSGKHDEAFYREMWEALDRGEVWHCHFINKKKDGSLYEEDATISPILDMSGKIVSYVAVKRDVR